MECCFDGLTYTVLAFAIARWHDSYATIFENGANITEVEVDNAVHGDNLGNRTCCHAQRVISLLKSREYIEFGINLTQTFIIDYQEGINVLWNFFYTIERLVNLLITLKEEGNGHNTNRKYAHWLCLTGDDGSSTCTRTTPHTRSDEYHFCTVVEHLLNLLNTLFGSLTSTCRTVARSQALFAYLKTNGYGRIGQSLWVGVAHNEVDIMNAFAIHVIDSVAAATTYTDYFYNRRSCGCHSHINQQIVIFVSHCFV